MRLTHELCFEVQGEDFLRHVRRGTRRTRSDCRPLAIQAGLLFLEDANEVVFDFEKLVWVSFYLCQSTEVLKFVSRLMLHGLTPAPTAPAAILFLRNERRSGDVWGGQDDLCMAVLLLFFSASYCSQFRRAMLSAVVASA